MGKAAEKKQKPETVHLIKEFELFGKTTLYGTYVGDECLYVSTCYLDTLVFQWQLQGREWEKRFRIVNVRGAGPLFGKAGILSCTFVDNECLYVSTNVNDAIRLQEALEEEWKDLYPPLQTKKPKGRKQPPSVQTRRLCDVGTLFGQSFLLGIFVGNECVYITKDSGDAISYSSSLREEMKPKTGFRSGHTPWNKGCSSSSWTARNSMTLKKDSNAARYQGGDK